MRQHQQPVPPKRHIRPDSDTFTDEVFDTRSNAASTGGTFSTNSGTRTGTFSSSGLYLSSYPFAASSKSRQFDQRGHFYRKLPIHHNTLDREQPRCQREEFIKTAYIGNIPYSAGVNEVRGVFHAA